MIHLNCPSSPGVYYANIQSQFYGPFDVTGMYATSLVNVDIDDGYLLEQRGIYGENNVVHRKYDGQVDYQPILLALTVATDSYYEERLTGYGYETGVYRSQNAVYGLAVSGRVYLAAEYISSGKHYHMWRANCYENGDWHYYQLVVAQEDPSRPESWSHSVYTGFFTMMNGSTRELRYKTYLQRASKPRISRDLSWWNKPSLEAMREYGTRYGYKPTNLTLQNAYYRSNLVTFNVTDVSPAALKKQLVAIVNNEFAHVDLLSPLRLLDYGELAHRAVQRVSTTNVNVLELLSDLRHPSELIPKLKGLTKLRTHAGNYLWYKFAALPTISDLSAIVAAFKRLGPYIDKNGFSTYSAGEDQVASDDHITFRLDQRIKLAIDDEDNALSELCQRLDNVGVFPRLEYIWDIIPYTFIVDWFVDVGGFLERIDTRLRLLQLNIRYVTCSYRKSTEIDLGLTALPLTGNVSQVHYHRWVSDQCPAPPASLKFSSDLSDHVIEGGMLLVQHRK